jgi:hypothetical protein
MKRSWRDEYRRCERCKAEYLPVRQAQSYCSRGCKRAAAYGRERFAAGTTGRRRRRLEASDKAPGLVAGTVRNGHFSSIETIPCKATFAPPQWDFDQWPRCKVRKRWEMLPRDGLPRHMFCIAVRKRERAKASERETAPEIRATGAVSQSPSTQHVNDGGSFVEPLNSPPECFLRC